MSDEVRLRNVEPNDLPVFYEHQLDAKFAAARGFVDAVITVEETREVLSFALRAGLHNPNAHIGPFGQI